MFLCFYTHTGVQHDFIPDNVRHGVSFNSTTSGVTIGANVNYFPIISSDGLVYNIKRFNGG